MPLKLTNRDSFPSNPTTDQVEIVDDVLYQYDGSEWNLLTQSSPNEARIVGSVDGPNDIKSSTFPDLQLSTVSNDPASKSLIISSASVDLSDAFVLVTPYESFDIESVTRSASEVDIRCGGADGFDRVFGIIISA